MTTPVPAVARPSSRPTFTVVVIASQPDARANLAPVAPLLDEARTLPGLEIVLVLTDDAADHAEHQAALSRMHPHAAYRVVSADADPGAARAAGVAAARGRLVTVLESGDEATPDYLRTLATTAPSTHVAVAGPTEGVAGAGAMVFPTWAIQSVGFRTGHSRAVTEALAQVDLASSYATQTLGVSDAPAEAGAVLRWSTPDAMAGALEGLRAMADVDVAGVTSAAGRAHIERWTATVLPAAAAGTVEADALLTELQRHGFTQITRSAQGAAGQALHVALHPHEVGSRNVVIAVGDAASSKRWASAVDFLSEVGDTVTLVSWFGAPSKVVTDKAFHLRTEAPSRLSAESRQRVRELLATADTVIAIDRSGRRLIARADPELTPDQGTLALFASVVRRVAETPETKARGAAKVLRKYLSGGMRYLSANPPEDDYFWPVLAMRNVGLGLSGKAAEVARVGRTVIGDESARRVGLEQVSALIAEDRDATALAAAAADALRRADERRAAGRTSEALWHQYLAFQLLFESTRHTSVPSTPLVDDPATYLAPLRASRLHQEMTATDDRHRIARRVVPGGGAVIFDGAFPKFSGVLGDALRDDMPVTHVGLGSFDARFRNVVMDLETFTGLQEPHLDRVVLDRVAGASVVVADWADKGLALLSRVVPRETRLVARVHGVDTLSGWVHLVDWTAVDAVIAPSEHLASALRAVVGLALGSTDVIVVPNPIDAQRFAPTKDPGAEHTLGLVGWAQRVKGTPFALDLLGRLRAEDDRWRLRLVGADFPERPRPVESRAAQEIRTRLTRPDVRGAVEFVPFTPDVGEVMSGIGWALSTSLRESFHLGLMEMAASGAVPVVRDWPVYARTSGASSLVPHDWVVGDVRAAAERIRRITEAGTWERERTGAREHVITRYDKPIVLQQLRAALLGENRP